MEAIEWIFLSLLWWRRLNLKRCESEGAAVTRCDRSILRPSSTFLVDILCYASATVLPPARRETGEREPVVGMKAGNQLSLLVSVTYL